MADLVKTPYSPNDFSTGKSLGYPHGQILNEPSQIASSLSLFFQWPNYHKAYIELFSNAPSLPCRVECDPEERVLSFIKVTCEKNGSNSSKIRIGMSVGVCLEIFNTCYTFETKILEEETSVESLSLILEIPESIVVQKLRKYPRILVDSLSTKNLPKLQLENKTDGKITSLDLLELGTHSIKVKGTFPKEIKANLLANGVSVPLRFIRSELERSEFETTVFELQFNTGVEAGLFFEIYQVIAFPYLIKKTDLPASRSIEVYESSGFFRKFGSSTSPEVLEKRKNEMCRVLDLISSGTHKTTMDYYSKDSSGNLTGASSIVLGFFNGELPVWVFQQLCSINKPELIEQTRELYTWRAEYLLMRPENFDLAVWVDSKSRWIERIWVKFAIQKNTGSNIISPVEIRVKSFKRDPEKTTKELPVKTYSIGDAQRTSHSSETTLAGVNPDYLNAANLLNHIYVNKTPVTLKYIESVAQNLLTSLDKTECEFRVSFPAGHTPPELANSPSHNLDRYVSFPKQDLPYYLSSVEHSLAVVKRKLMEYGEAS